jgi:GTPase SAR1 family protein
MLKTQGLTPVTTEQGLAVARKMNAAYMECSSKEMTGVEEIFEQAILTVVANDRKNLEAQAAAGNSGRPASSGRLGSGPGGVIPGLAPIKKKKRKCIHL